MNKEEKYRILRIIRGTTVDGPGFRTAIYIAGCNHHCPGCQNPQSWSFNAGDEMSLSEILEVIKEEDFDVTLTGGDPMCSPQSTLKLAKAIKTEGYGIWMYTGYLYEEIAKSPELRPILDYVDVVVDGPYIEKKRNIDLKFRGSSNQRIITSKGVSLT